MTYYLVHTKPREELRAQEQLSNQGYECFLPQFLGERIQAGKRVAVLQPLFPRYLFIRLNSETDNWAPIRSTQGVSQMVRFGIRYASVDDDFIEALRARLQPAEMEPKPLFENGQALRIVRGPFAGLDAIFKENDGDARIVVLLNFLQQQKPVSMPIDAVKLAA
jgi:transcriptional antiterminator RfaH